jgi:hypothetical protein
LEALRRRELHDAALRRQRWSTKARLAAEILRTYASVRRRLGRRRLPAVLAGVRDGSPAGGPSADTPRSRAQAARLGRAVRRTLGALPADSTCLIESVVLIALLERRGVASSLVIGVEPAGGFRAHAWVELLGEPLLPDGEGAYERLVEL